MFSEQDFFSNKQERKDNDFVWMTLDKCSEEIFTKAEMLDVNSFPEFLVDNSHTKDKFIWLADVFKDSHIVFLDDKKERVLAVGFSAPMHLDDDALPENGWEGGVDKIISDYEQKKKPNTLMALSASVSVDARGQGLGGKILEGYLQRAQELNLSKVIAPARPISKNKFPDLTMEEYVNLYDSDTGEHRDPWIRTHIRCGGKIAGIGRNSHVVHFADGSWPSVQKWQEWTGMNFNKDGFYDIPDGNAKLHIHDGIGEYREDCIWIVYDL
jgi:GNAT superfamily N-acetyltransferase